VREDIDHPMFLSLPAVLLVAAVAKRKKACPIRYLARGDAKKL